MQIQKHDKSMDNVHDYSVGGLQVQTQTAGSRRQYEDLVLGILDIEELHKRRALFCLGTTVETQVFPAHHPQEVLHDIHDFCHLEENQNLESVSVDS